MATALPTQAALRTFASTEATNDFNLAANWGGSAPGAGDVAVVPAGTSTTLTAGITVGQLSATGTVNAANFNLTVDGATYVDNAGVVTSTSGILTLTGAVSSTGAIGTVTGGIAFGGTFLNEDTLNIAAGTATSTGALTNAAGATINVNTGTLSLAAGLTNSGTLNALSGTIRLAGGSAQAIDHGSALLNNLVSIKSAGTATLSASSTLLGTLTTTGAGGGTIDSQANALTVVGASNIGPLTTVTSTSGVLTLTGAVSSTGSIGSSSGDVLFGNTLQNNGTLDIGSGVTTSTGVLTNAGTINGRAGTLILSANLTNTGTLNAHNGTVKYRGTTTANDRTLPSVVFRNLNIEATGAGVYNWPSTSTVAGTLTVASSTNFTNAGAAATLMIVGDLVNAGTLGLATSNVTTSGSFINSGTFNGGTAASFALGSDLINTGGTFAPQTGNFVFTGSVAQTVMNGVLFYNVNVTKSGAAAVVLNSSSTVLNLLTLNGAGSLNAAAANFTVVSTTTVYPGNTVTSTAGVLAFGGPVTSTGSIGSSSGNMSFATTFDNNGTFSLGSGTATSTGALANAGTLNGNSGTLVLSSTFTSGGTFNAQTGTVKFRGNSTPGAFILPALIYNNLNVETTGLNGMNTAASTTIVGNLIIGSTGHIGDLSGGITVVGDLTNAGDFNISNAPLGAVTTTGNFINTGTFIAGTSGDIFALQGNLTNSGSFNPLTGTFKLIGGGAQSLASVLFYNLNVAKTSSVATLAGSSTVLGTLTMDGSTATLNADTQNLTVTAATVNATNVVTSTSGILTFTGAASSTGAIGSSSGNMLFGNTLQNNGTLSLGGTATTTGVFTNVGTINQNAGTLVIVGGLSQGGTFNPHSGTTIYHGSSLAVAETVYRNLRVRGTATFGDSSASTTVAGTFDIDPSGTLTVTNSGTTGDAAHIRLVGVATNGGTLTMNGTSYGPTVTSTAAFTNTGTINATGTIDFNSSFTNSGTFSPGTSLVRYTGSSASNVGAAVYYLVNFMGGATYTVTASTTAVATTTILAGNTLTLGSQTYTGYGDITNLGTVVTSTGSFRHPLDYVRITDENGSVLTTTNDAGYIDVRLKDQNRNLNGAAVETLLIPVSVNAGAGGDYELMTLTETTASSGIFHNLVHMNVRGATVSAGNERIDLTADGTGTVSYVDTFGTDTGTVTIALTLIPRSSSGGGGGAVSSGGGGGSSSNVPVVVSNPAVVPPVLIPPPSTTFPVRFPVTPTVGTPTTLAIPPASVTLRTFLDNGGTSASRALGSGERAAILRDLQETTGRVAAAVPVDDLERVANGQIPRTRNLAYERSMAPRALQTFRTIFGHAPNFKVPAENLAWNTLMYRIRFQRNLSAEQGGIRAFRSTFRLTPSTPFQWATVRVMGYIAR